MRDYPNSVQTPQQRRAKYAMLRSLGYSVNRARVMRDFHDSTIRNHVAWFACHPQAHLRANGGVMA